MEELHNQKTTATSARRASSRMWFGTVSLCTTPILADLRRKPQKMLLRSPPKNCNHRTAKRKQNRPMDSKSQRNMPDLRRTFVDKENTRTQWRSNATSQDRRTCCCWRMSSKTSAGKVCLNNNGWIWRTNLARLAWAGTLFWKRWKWSLRSWEIKTSTFSSREG